MSKAVQLIAGGKEFDAFLAEAALERVLAAALGGQPDEAPQSFRGDESSWVQVIDAARTRSLFVARKAVVVRQAESLRGDDEAVAAYLKDPTPGVTLVLLAAKPDKRKAVWKKLFEAAEVTLAEPLKGARLRAYVSAELRRRRLSLESDAIEALIERVGAELRRLMGEIDKLEAYAAGERLSAETVEQVLGRGFARPLYEISDAFSERAAARSLALVELALADGEAPLRILATLHRALRQTRVARALRAAPRAELVSRLGLNPRMEFKLPAILEGARRWDEPALEAATAALSRADRGIKTGCEPRAALAAALVAACHGSSARP